MIPILYSPFERAFTSNGIGRLSECISCTVTEERNGIFECEFTYPINGKFYQTLIGQNNIVGVIHDDHKDIQPFEIYRHSDPIDGIVTFNAHHISYSLANVIVDPFTADTCADALQGMVDNAITQNDFTFWTDKATSGTFKVNAPDNVRALLCGQQGSILDVYGTGEYEFDKYLVRLYTHRGQDRGVTIRYGKNLADINRTYDQSGIYNAVIPYWADPEGNLVMLPEKAIYDVAGASNKYPWEESINGEIITDENGTVIEFKPFQIIAVPLDLSDQFEEQPTEAELRTAAQNYLTNNEPWVPHDNIEVNFVALWQTPEYENVAALQRVSLCDTVAIYYPELGVTNASAKVIKIVYNVLSEQYDSMELGEAKATLAQTISEPIEAELGKLTEESKSFTAEAIAKATEMITGGLGGYVVMNLNADGQPQEILIMDTDDINTAVNVIRMNKNGIGFSTTGYEGPYTSAWTIDGAFNADFITAGTMLANRIYGGTLTIGGINNQSGVIVVKNASNVEVGRWNNAGIVMPISADGSEYAALNAQGFQINRQTAGSIYTSDIWYGGTGDYRPPDGAVVGGLTSEYTYGSETWVARFLPTRLEISRITQGGQQQRFWADIESGFGMQNLEKNGADGSNYRGFTFNYANSSVDYVSMTGNFSANHVYAIDGLQTAGNLIVAGYKGRKAETSQYGDRILYCYETASPLFGDVGEGVLDEDGLCYVFLDPILADTITTRQYQVFLQKYGDGDCWIAERKAGYFVVQGTAGLSFGWELKAKQNGFDQLRIERYEEKIYEDKPDYERMAANFIAELEERRKEAS